MADNVAPVTFQLIDQVPQPVLDSFFFYATLLSLKLLSNSVMTGKNRIAHKVSPNPEDKLSKAKSHPDVDRAVRVHRNDFENIVPFFFLALIFTMITGERLSQFYCKAIFRVFFFSRISMSICHYYEIQPWRSIFWFMGFACNAVLAYFIAEKIGTSADNIQLSFTRYM